MGKYGAPTYVLYQLPGFETVIREGTEEQIDAVLATLGSGEQIWNSACTEPGAGSDVGALATTYKRENGKIYLNGTKTFITSSAGVKYLVIMAKNADDESMFTEFFLDMSKPGVKLSPLTKLGLRMDSCCEVYLDNVELEEKDIFGKEGNGFMRGVSDFNFERWLVGACDYGTAISAFEDAMAHANSRIAFGKPLSRFQLNQLKIAEMCIKLTNMKNMLYESRLERRQQRRQLRSGRGRHVQVLLRQRRVRGDRRRHADHGRHRGGKRASHQPHLARPARGPRLRRHRRDDGPRHLQGSLHQVQAEVAPRTRPRGPLRPRF